MVPIKTGILSFNLLTKVYNELLNENYYVFLCEKWTQFE